MSLIVMIRANRKALSCVNRLLQEFTAEFDVTYLGPSIEVQHLSINAALAQVEGETRPYFGASALCCRSSIIYGC